MQLSKALRPWVVTGLAMALTTGVTGCAGMNNSLSQSLGINSGARVPPPSTGSFAAPNNYTGTPQSSNMQPASGAVFTPNTTGNTTGSTSQFNPLAQPAGQLISGINQAQSQFLQATDQARNTINQTAEGLNSRVNTVGERIDRFNQGVAQASAIMHDAVQAPPPQTMPSAVGSGVAPASANLVNEPDPTWRKPNY